MEWKSSTDKEKYGDVVGEVIHHTLFEDGTITRWTEDTKKIIRGIKTSVLCMLVVFSTGSQNWRQ